MNEVSAFPVVIMLWLWVITTFTNKPPAQDTNVDIIINTTRHQHHAEDQRTSQVLQSSVFVIDVQLNQITAQFLPRPFNKTVSPTCRGPFEHLSCVTSLFEDGPVVVLVNDSDH